jgi:2-polyprenyl-3-methyl-5-hydroxy-6-metoxy-1,4-benzoquinol methylase
MSYFTHDRPELLPLIPNDTKALLDVGCGAGTFGKNVKKILGCVVWGIEPVREPALEAQKVLDKVVIGLFDEALPQITGKFDAVCFNDVLEHMPDPWDALHKTKNLLNQNGVVIASMPNILHYQEFLDILFKKDWKYKEAGIMDKTHLRFFTKKSIVRMFEDCGYSILEIKGLDPTPSKKMTLISFLTFGYLSEMRYPQFAIKAKPII